jgi:hypothetical protein
MNQNFWRNLLFLTPFVPLLLAGSCSTTTSPPIVPSPPVINSFTATPFEAIGTANATLAWNVTGATALSINQGIGTVTGSSTTQAISSSKTFTLTASNSAGVSVTRDVTVTIELVAANALGLNSNVNVNGLNAEKFTWIDNEAKTRTISLVRNDQPGTKGGFMEQFSYVLPDSSTRTINANAAGVRGFGFIVSHLKDASLAIGEDDSPIGSPLNNAWRMVWRGSNHALLEYTLNYPRWGKNGAGVATKYNMPVTIHWLIQNGKRYPLWSVTMDLSAVPTNAVEADSRAPYGEMEFSGNAADLVNGVAWGDSHHFKSTTAPLTLNSSWDWTGVNTSAAYNSLFTPNNAEMGIVGTRVISKQDAGGYEGSDGLRGNTSAGHACNNNPEQHAMPCLFQWSYQSVNYSFSGSNDSTNNKRFAWGADWGYLGQTTYTPMNNNYAATPGSLPKRSYSTWIVLDPRSAVSSPTRDLSDQAKTIDDTVLTVTGAANKKLSGAKGIGDITLETYSPAGFNHVYSTWEAELTGAGVVGLNWQVPVGQSLVGSSIVLNNYTRAIGPTSLSLNGTALIANQDYFASVIPSTQQLWITLKNNLSNSATLTITP